MKLKKINAVISLLSILFMMLHMGYSVYTYITFYYNPTLTKIFAIPFMILVCIHAICGMLAVFLQTDGTTANLYPKQNMQTIIQRVSAALIFPLLILHMNMFDLMRSAMQIHIVLFVILIIVEVLFFGTVITHIAVSFSKALITLGILSSADKKTVIDRIVYVIGATAFVIAVFAIVKVQLMMFMG